MAFAMTIMTLATVTYPQESYAMKQKPAMSREGPAHSRMAMAGMPRFVLTVSPKSGDYEINAECIDTPCDDRLQEPNGDLTYHWGIKYPNEEIRWIETNVPKLTVQSQSRDEKIVVFLEITDANGNKSELQHIEIHSPDVYLAENQNLYIDANGQLYKANKQRYSYSYARLHLTYREGLPEKYKGREWMPTTATILKPFSSSSQVEARDGGPLIKDILPTSELDHIKNNSEDGQVYRYVLILLNYKSKAIQFIPITFTYKTNIQQ